jgi:antitoxin YefM
LFIGGIGQPLHTAGKGCYTCTIKRTTKGKAMRIMTYSEVRSNFKTVIDNAIDDVDVTVIHRRDGEDAVLMGRDHYESLLETLHLLSTPANARALNNAIAQDKARHGVRSDLLDSGE